MFVDALEPLFSPFSICPGSPTPSWLSLIQHHQHEILCCQSLVINSCILVLYPPNFQTCAFVWEILHYQSSLAGIYISLPIFVFVCCLFCFGEFLWLTLLVSSFVFWFSSPLMPLQSHLEYASTYPVVRIVCKLQSVCVCVCVCSKTNHEEEANTGCDNCSEIRVIWKDPEAVCGLWCQDATSLSSCSDMVQMRSDKWLERSELGLAQ